MSEHTLEGPLQWFAVRVAHRGPTTVMSLVGEFDSSCTLHFRRELRNIGRKEPGRLLIDLLEVSFIDSAGLRMILDAWTWAQAERIEFAVVRGGARVRRIFELSGLNRVLPMVDFARSGA